MAERGIPKARGRNSRRWREVIRPSARRRDEAAQARCWICNQDIDYTLPDGHQDSWSPDHIYPVADYPELAEDLANIAPSHLSCNKSRGKTDRFTPDLGAPSRTW